MVTERQAFRTCLKLYKKKFILGGTLGIYTVAGMHVILQLTVGVFLFGFFLLWTYEEESWAKPQCKSCTTFQLCQ